MGQQQRRTADPLAVARQALVDVEELIRKLESERMTILLGDDAGHLARIDGRLDAARREHRTAVDRLKAREAEEARQAQAKAEAAKLVKVGKVENKLRWRDELGAELAKHIAAADATFCKLIEVGRQVQAAWDWAASDMFATMIADGAILAAARNEIFRVGGRTPLTGGELDTRPPSFPGGEPERVEFLYQPERTQALVDKLADATATAGRLMRTGRNDPAPIESAPLDGQVRPMGLTPAPEVQAANGHEPPKEAPAPNPELGRLVQRQNEIADMSEMDAAAEAEYATIGKQIMALS